MRSKQSNNGQDHRILFRVTEKKALFLFFLIVVVYWRILYMHCYSINLTVVYNNCGYRREAGHRNNIKWIKKYQKAKDNFEFFFYFLGGKIFDLVNGDSHDLLKCYNLIYMYSYVYLLSCL